MNKARREKIAEALSLLSQARTIIEDVQTEEQDAFDNMPEGLQSGERGETMSRGLEYLDAAVSSFDDIEASLEDAKA